MIRRAISLFVLLLGFIPPSGFGAWADSTAGLPPVEIISAKTMGADGSIMSVALDKLGRLFIGSNRLLVFDGQTWRSFPKPNSYPLTSLVMGDGGRLWAGTTNELGYFQEESLGAFKFYSLLSYLPKEARDIGIVWGCAPVGQTTYFICSNSLLRWNGRELQVTPHETEKRLFPLRVENEWWFYQFETGLYRLTENAPTLVIPAAELKNIAIMGMYRDEIGFVTVSNKGFLRPGKPPELISEEKLNNYLSKHLVSAFAALSDGNLVIGTVSGGVVLASRTGRLIKVWDSSGGLPGRIIMSLATDPSGDLLGTTPTDFFHFPITGKSSLFNAKNGLDGPAINYLKHWNSSLYAVTENGNFHQKTFADGKALFQVIPELTEVYTHALPYQDGLLLSRLGGVDTFDGNTIRPVYQISVGDIFAIIPTKANPDEFYVSDTFGLARVEGQLDGPFVRTNYLKLPDTCISLCEDSTGRLWIGTVTRGAFNYDPATNTLSPINDPTSGEMLPGPVVILGDDQRILILFAGGILQADAHGQGLHPLNDLPAFTPLDVGHAPNGRDVLVTYKRAHGANALAHGVGVLSFDDFGHPSWRELDIAALGTIGPIRSLTFSDEANQPILWLGGTEGILRLDYDSIPTLQPPPAPIIRSDASAVAGLVDGNGISFPFKDHHVRLMVFAGDYVRGKDWLIQTRLGSEATEWSAPAEQRSFEFTNLSEGNYQFAARAVNTAGMFSASTSLTFIILPPWYRTKRAYAGYAVGVTLLALGFIRIRERRIRIRNRELEDLVDVRTGELLKANAAKDEFLASISHEIRNPMNGVLGIAESLKTEALDPQNRHRFGLLRQCASHLSSLLEDILDFSRVQAGVELEPKPFNLSELMESVTALTIAESEKRGIPVEIAISPAVPPQLTGDPRRIRQILLNFVSNALKYAGRGQVKVTIWCKKNSPASTEVFFAISDEGPGISPKEQKKLFTRFERGTTAQLGRVPGTGLGLALCRTLAEKWAAGFGWKVKRAKAPVFISAHPSTLPKAYSRLDSRLPRWIMDILEPRWWSMTRSTTALP